MREQPWIVPVRIDDVGEAGNHYDLEADAGVRAAAAKLAGVLAVPRLTAQLDVVRSGDGLRVTGQVSATVRQTCVVTLEPIENQVEEAVDLTFSPSRQSEAAENLDQDPNLPDPPEPLVDGTVDLGALAVEFLVLGIDPYPRKPGAVFEQPAADEADKPFAALAALKKGEGTG